VLPLENRREDRQLCAVERCDVIEGIGHRASQRRIRFERPEPVPSSPADVTVKPRETADRDECCTSDSEVGGVEEFATCVLDTESSS
jgi:hypothetical protein